MNPIQVHCPECQKLFYVRPEDLKPGLVKFRCTVCQTYFGFNWPQPEGITAVQAQRIDLQPAGTPVAAVPAKKKTSTGVPPLSKVVPVTPAGNPTGPSVTRTKNCFSCSQQVDAKATECPYCGVIFDKVKKIRPPEPVVPPAGPDIVEAWNAVKTNYDDEKRHEGFVQLCMNRDNLAYASSMYRAILEANPAEDIANRMQNRIVELATATYLSHQKPSDVPTRGIAFQNMILVIAALMVVTGVVYAPLRSLIAVGASFIIFIVTMRFYSARS